MTTDLSLERGLPASPEAERSILGAILLDNDMSHEALATLRPDHFFLDAHRRIYQRIADLAEQGKSIDITTLITRLMDAKELDAVGGAGYLASLTDGVPRRSSVAHYVEIVRDKATLRSVIHAGNAMVAESLDQSATAEQILSGAEESLLKLRAEAQSTNAVQHVSGFAADTYEQFQARAANKNATVDFPIGIENVDRFSGGIKRMTVLAGRTGEGKSAVATQCVYANASQGKPVLIFSPEMTRDEVLMRMVAQQSKVPAWKFEKPHLMEKWELAEVAETFAMLNKLPFYVDDTSAISSQEISARARLAQRRYKVELCIVDYVQLLDSRGRDQRTEVSNSSRVLRMLGKDIMPVLVLSQMPRPKDNLNVWPTKYDLKESGSLENDSYKIFIIRREVDEKNLPTGTDHMCVLKNRGGRVGVEPIAWSEDNLTYSAKY
jgi:replicative DNA helicase